MKNTALLIIDMINDFQFSHVPILAKKCETITNPILQLKKKMKSFGYPIIYVNDHYQLWRSDIDQLITHCTNEYSENIIHKIAPSFDEYIFIKPHYSAFYETPSKFITRLFKNRKSNINRGCRKYMYPIDS